MHRTTWAHGKRIVLSCSCCSLRCRCCYYYLFYLSILSGRSAHFSLCWHCPHSFHDVTCARSLGFMTEQIRFCQPHQQLHPPSTAFRRLLCRKPVLGVCSCSLIPWFFMILVNVLLRASRVQLSAVLPMWKSDELFLSASI